MLQRLRARGGPTRRPTRGSQRGAQERERVETQAVLDDVLQDEPEVGGGQHDEHEGNQAWRGWGEQGRAASLGKQLPQPSQEGLPSGGGTRAPQESVSLAAVDASRAAWAV